MSQGDFPNQPEGGLVRAPALPTDVDEMPLELDPEIGEEAFSRQAAALRAIAAADVALPNCDVAIAALMALQLVRATRAPDRVGEFNGIRRLLRASTPEALEDQAWALWYLDVRAKSVKASTSKVKVDSGLIKEAKAARKRALELLRYYLGDDPRMLAELQDINMGSGFMDIAQDLARLAGHLSVHRGLISRDTKYYRADDELRFRGLANEIVAQLKADRGNETADLRNRAWTQMVLTYGHVKAAADLIYYNMPAELAFFPPLRAAVLAAVGRPRRARNQKGGASESGEVLATPAEPSPGAPTPGDDPLET